jgi:hypothetical protein
VTLESVATEFDKSFGAWKPEVDSSLSSVKLELSKLNSFFDHNAKSGNCTKPRVLPLESVTASPTLRGSGDGPNGNRVHINRDCGFGRVFTQIHDPVKGTILPSPPLPNSPPIPEFELSYGPSWNLTGRAQLGKLPKMNFPQFDGDNPKLWQSRCEKYFDMYSTESSMWVRVASMHFDGLAPKWLQSVNH